MGGGAEYWRPGGGRDQQAAATEQWRASQSQSGGGNAPPPGMMLNPNYNPSKAMLTNVPMPGSKEALERQMYIPATAGTANPYGTPPADGGGYKTGFTSFNDLQEQLRLEKQYRDNPIKLDSKGQPIISSPFDNPQGSPYGTPPAGGGMNRPGVMDDSILGRYSGSSYGGAPMTQGPESMFYNMGGLGSLFGGGGFRYY